MKLINTKNSHDKTKKQVLFAAFTLISMSQGLLIYVNFSS